MYIIIDILHTLSSYRIRYLKLLVISTKHQVIHWFVYSSITAVSVGVEQTSYTVSESDGFVTIGYVLNRPALQDVTINVTNADVSATSDIGKCWNVQHISIYMLF